LLLEYLQVSTVILTGIATDNCVLYTASDAYMRDLKVVVPEDCVAAIEPRHHEAALDQMRSTLKADTTPSTDLDLESLARVPRGGVEQSVG
jgi:nicotinamidase-related amidase